MLELHVVQSGLFRHLKHGDKSTPVLALEGLALAELEQRPRHFVLLNLVQKVAGHNVFVSLLELILPFDEEILELEESLLSESYPVFFAEVFEFFVKGLEAAPSSFLLNEIFFEPVVVWELGRSLAEVLAVALHSSHAFFEGTPLGTDFFHHLSSFNCDFFGQLVPFLRFLLLPLLKQLFEIIVELGALLIDLLGQPGLLVFNLVVEGVESGIEFSLG